MESKKPEIVDESSEECMRNSVYFKTQPCFKFMQGRCRFSSCKFAHGTHELRNPSKMADADYELQRARNNNNEGSRNNCSVSKEASNNNGCVPLQRQQQGFKRRRVCYQYEATGTCSFGDNCRYPHESLEVVQEGHKDCKNAGSYVYPKAQSDWKLQTPNRYPVPCPASNSAVIDVTHFTDKTASAHPTSIHKSMDDIDSSNNNVIQISASQKRLSRWKGPQKISRIYGDWIDEYDI